MTTPNGEGWEEGTTRLGNRMSADKQTDGEKMYVENIKDESKKVKLLRRPAEGEKKRK